MLGLEFLSLGLALGFLSGVLSLGELTIRVGITSRRGSGVGGSTSGLGIGGLLSGSLVRKRRRGQTTLELVGSPLVRSGLSSLPRFVESSLIGEVRLVGSSLLSPSDLLLGVGPLGVELSDGLGLLFGLLGFTFSGGLSLISLRSFLGLISGVGSSRLSLSELSPDTVTHVVEGGSGLGTIMVSTCLVNFGLKYLHFVRLLLSESLNGGDSVVEGLFSFSWHLCCSIVPL